MAITLTQQQISIREAELTELINREQQLLAKARKLGVHDCVRHSRRQLTTWRAEMHEIQANK